MKGVIFISTYYKPGVPLSFDNCPKVLEAYLRDRQTKGLSPRTCIAYYMDIRSFLQYIHFLNRFDRPPQEADEHLDLDVRGLTIDEVCQVTPEIVHDYFYFLTDYAQNSCRTKNRKLASLKAFYNWLLEENYRDAVGKIYQSPMVREEKFKEAKKTPIYLQDSESQRLLNCINGSVIAVRDYAIFILFLSSGIRLSELTAINVRDVDFEGKAIRIHGKGNKERLAFPSDAAMEAIQRYLIEYRDLIADKLLDKNALFVSSQTFKRLTARQIERLMTKYLAAAGLQGRGFSPHKLRHTAATMLANDGVSVQVIQAFLGHESLSTTSIYTHMIGATVKEAVHSSPLSAIGAPSQKPLDEVEAMAEDYDRLVNKEATL